MPLQSLLRRALTAGAVAAGASVALAAPASASPVEVRSGDTLTSIAARHGTTWQALYEQNRSVIGRNPNVLRVGQVLSVGGGQTAPAPAAPARAASVSSSGGGAYVVQSGDTLSSIASRHGTTWQRLHAANRDVIGSNPNVLRVGQRLVVELAAVATTSARAVPASRSAARSSGDPRDIAAGMVNSRGWSTGQFNCLDRLWHAESGWRHTAQNPSSGAYGIPQALPASKMASAGSDWRTNASTQIAWGLGYIADRYGSPCGAWDHFQARSWY